MGLGPSLDAEIAEAKQILADFNVAFAKNYAMCYAIGMMKASQKLAIKQAAAPRWKLLKATKEPDAPIRKTGHMLKLSKYLKKWNKRFFVVRGNWIVDYWEKEEQFHAGAKPRGSMNLSGMTIVRDVNNTIIRRIEVLAEKCKLNIADFPKPEQYPDFTLEVHHESRESIYLQCLNAEEFKSWADMLDDCRWYCDSLTITDDKIHKEAFWKALWRTRWEVDMWGWFSSGGGETAILADAINEQIAYVVMSKIDSKLTMPWMARSKIRNAFTSSTGAAVTTAVGPAWAAAYDLVKRARSALGPKIAELGAEIGAVQQKISAKILEMVEASSKETLQEKVAPHLIPLVDAVFGCVVDSFRMTTVAYDSALSKGREGYKAQEDRMHLVWHQSYNSDFWDADRKLWDLYDPLWDMRRVFDDVSPWGIMGKARRRLRKTLNNALFTFETRLEEAGGAEHWDRVAAEVREVMIEDCRTSVLRVLGKILFGVVEVFWDKLVIRTARKLVRPLADEIPDAVKQFLDPEDMLEKLLYDILMLCCTSVFEPYASRIAF